MVRMVKYFHDFVRNDFKAWFTCVKRLLRWQEQVQEQEKGKFPFFLFLRLCLLHTCEPGLIAHAHLLVIQGNR